MTRQITIAHVITDLGVGGAEVMLRNLVQRMDRTRFRNVVISLTDRGFFADDIERAGVAVEALGIERGRPDPRLLVRLRRSLKKHQPDIVQTWLYHADLLGTLVRRAVPDATLLWNVRCSFMEMRRYNPLSGMTRRMLAMMSKVPTAVVVNSVSGREVHERLGYRPRRWVLLPNGFDTERFKPDSNARSAIREELGLAEDTFLVGTVGRFDPMKDHATFLAAAELVARDVDAHFVLAGRGLEASNSVLVDWIRSRGLVGRVHLLGPRKDVAAIDAALDVFCFASRYGEGFPNVVGEAMACATPCVVTDVGDAAAIVGDTGTVAAPGDAAGLADGVNKLLRMSSSERRQIGARARARIENDYSIGSIVRQYEKFYDEIAEQRGLT